MNRLLSTSVASFGILLLVFVGCERSEKDDPLSDSAGPGRSLTFTATLEDISPTRTQLDESLETTLWSARESINIFYGASQGSRFISTNTTPVSNAEFIGELTAFTGIAEGGEPLSFWAVYPYSAADESTGSSVTVMVPASQSGIVGNVPERARSMVAKSPGLSLSFKHVASRLKLWITEPDITHIVVRGNQGEIIAGRVSVTMDGEGNPVWSPIEGEGATEITIRPASGSTFQYGDGVFYFMPLLPQKFNDGITVTFYGTDKYGSTIVKGSDGTVTFTRTGFNGARTSKVTTWTPLEHPSNEIWYTTSDGCAAQYNAGADYADEIEIVAPSDNDGIGIVRFPTAIETVLADAFNASMAGDNNRKITSIILPETVETIREGAFANCNALASIQMDGVKYIHQNAFYSCGFETLSLPEGLVGIGYCAFQWCDQLRSVRIPESVTALGYPYMFYENPFLCCTALESFSGKFATDDGLALLSGNSAGDRNVLVSFASGAMEGGTYTVPDGVLNIAPCAFSRSKLAEVNLNEVTYLFASAMSDSGLKRIHIPSTVTGLGAYALAGCSDLENIRIDVTTSLPSIGSHVFDDSTCPIYVPAAWLEVFKTTDKWSDYADRYQALPSKNQIVYLADSQIAVGENLTPSDHTFSNGRGVLTFSDPVTEIPARAFAGTAITDVFLPEGITIIGESAFSDCGSLTSITLPGTLQYLGASAFDASGLESVTIPESVQYIGCTWDASSGEVTNHAGNPFTNCTSLASFSGKYATANGLFLVDDGYLVSGAIGAPALGEGQYCVIPSEVTTVGKFALAYGKFSHLSCMGAQVLDNNCFYGCSNLSYFEMGYNVTEIRSQAFAIPYGLTGSLVMVNFMRMNDLPEITTDAFKNQNNVELWISGWQGTNSAATMNETWGVSPVKERVRVHQHWDEIWVHFAGTGTITSDFLTDIQNKFLSGDGTVIGLNGYAPLATQYAVVPKSVFPAGIDGANVYVLKYNSVIKQLAANAFSATGNALDYISLPHEVASIGESAFAGLGLLKKFPGGDNDSFYPLNYLTSIGENAFNGCVSMAGSVPMPDVTSLGADAFKNCKALTSVTLGPVSSIPSGAFYECNALQSVTLNVDNLTTIGSEAFFRCNALTKVASADQGSGHVYLPYVTSVGSFAFLSNYGIRNLDLGQYVSSTTLGTGAFDACSSLLTVNMPNVSTVPPMCFFSCSSLNYINALQITSIGNQGFYRCSSLKSLEFPAIVTIGDQAFGQTRSLTTLDLGENLESFGNEVFYDTDSSRRNTNKLSIYLRGTKWYYNEGNTNSIYNWSIWEAFNYNLAEEQAFFRFAAMYVPAQIYADVDQYLQGTFGPLEDL